jgi:hypothetical protein
MKLAWLISGLYKNSTGPILKLAEWLRAQPEFEQVDIYMYIWWDTSYVGKRYSVRQLGVVEEDPTHDIVTKIKPVKWRLVKQAQFDLSGLPFLCEAACPNDVREAAFFTHFSQFTAMRECLNLIENLDEYDAILRMRGDLCLHDLQFSTNFTKEAIQTNKIWVADGKFFTGWPYGDWAFFGNTNVMKHYIRNAETIFRQLCISLKCLPHLHRLIEYTFLTLNIGLERWFVPLRITRCCQEHTHHLLTDTSSNDINEHPYFFSMLDKERLAIP